MTLELTDDKKLKINVQKLKDEIANIGKIEFYVTCNLLDFLNEVIKSLERLLKAWSCRI